ncbi:MAG: hypothetical protein ACTS3F_09270 [Phycisphaerales bacterium]
MPRASSSAGVLALASTRRSARSTISARKAPGEASFRYPAAMCCESVEPSVGAGRRALPELLVLRFVFALTAFERAGVAAVGLVVVPVGVSMFVEVEVVEGAMVVSQSEWNRVAIGTTPKPSKAEATPLPAGYAAAGWSVGGGLGCGGAGRLGPWHGLRRDTWRRAIEVHASDGKDRRTDSRAQQVPPICEGLDRRIQAKCAGFCVA